MEMQAFQAEWQSKLVKIEEYLQKDLEGKDCLYKTIYHAMNYSVQSGGKRIRPILLMACYELFSNETEAVFPFCAALEYIHTYSLIHDDLPCMDDDDMRRGNPTCHVKFGEAMAVLAGDALLNKAYEKIFSSSHPRAMQAGEIISFYAGTEGMIGGQVVDMESEGKEISLEVLEKLQELKTGALLSAACGAGAVLGGANIEETEQLKEFGKILGLAFQIQDDILDVISTSEELGKPVGSDEKNQKTTYISLLGLEKCQNLNRRLTEQAIEKLDSFKDKADFLRKLALWLLNRRK